MTCPTHLAAPGYSVDAVARTSLCLGSLAIEIGVAAAVARVQVLAVPLVLVPFVL